MKRAIQLTIIAIIFFCFTFIKSKTTITIPRSPDAVVTGDIDNDGDIDIITGHYYNFQTSWAGISRIVNNGGGNYHLQDSIFVDSGSGDLNIAQLDDSSSLEFIGREYLNDLEHIIIVWNNDFSDIQQINLGTDEHPNHIATGDVDGNGLTDIVFASNNGYLWGVLYNYGNRLFSTPEFHNTDSPPMGIECGNLNDVNRADIIVSYADLYTDIYHSYDGYYDTLTIGGIAGSMISIADFDNDSDNDVVISIALMALAGKTSWIENVSNDTLIHIKDTVISDWYPSDMHVTDLNNDNLPDIAFINGFPTPEPPDTTIIDTVGGIYILYNKGYFIFTEPEYIPLNYNGDSWRTFSCNDMDGNGYNDFVVARNRSNAYMPGKVNVLYNDGNGGFSGEPQYINEPEQKKTNSSIRCFPNPFITETDIEYEIKTNASVALDVYNLNGSHIISLTNKDLKGAGLHTATWNGFNKFGTNCKPGAYIAVLRINNQPTQSIKLIKSLKLQP